jgi:ribosomal protein S12 methylthiotransferase accessory factor
MRLEHHPPSSSDGTLIKAIQLVGTETGVIKMIYEAPTAPDASQIFGCAALCSNLEAIGFPSESQISGSTALTRDQSIVGAIGEAVERYSAAYTPNSDIVHKSYIEIAGDAVNPEDLILYDQEQQSGVGFGYFSPASDQRIGWIEGWSLTRERPVFVPAFCVYQPYTSTTGELPVVQQITTGLACGATPEEAILAGMCEVLERDATMLLWLQSRKTPRANNRSDLPDDVAQVFKKFGKNARYVSLLDATHDTGIPAYVAMWDGPLAGRNGAVFASCAKPFQSSAAIGALTELAQCLMWVDSLIAGETSIPHPLTGKFEKIEHHVAWPFRPDTRQYWDFASGSSREALFSSNAQNRSKDVLDDIERCVERVAAAGLETIAVDVTSPDIREVGLHVWRIIIPHAQPLFFGTGMHRISSRALRNYYPERASPSINIHPHPFP